MGDDDDTPPVPDAVVVDGPSGGRVDAAFDAAPKPDAPPEIDAEPHLDAPWPDAPPAPPDAPPAPDAPPGTPDAPPAPPDAPPCTPTWQNLLANPAFDGGRVSWVESSSGGWALIVASADLPIAPQTPDYAVWLGGDYDATDQIYQDVTVPADATALQLKGYRLIGTEESGGAYDVVRVQIRDTGNAVLHDLVAWSNADSVDAWTAFDLTVPAPHAGQTIRVFLVATTDSTLNTNFFFDTLALNAQRCL